MTANPPRAVVDRSFGELTAIEWYGLARLRSEVFVVEQQCPYLDLDGRDHEPGTRHLWIDGVDGPVAYLRVLDDTGARRIGRVVTAPPARGHGLAAELLRHALATTQGPWVLSAQAHLADWYAREGFEVTGPAFDEDGIAHVPMTRNLVS